MPSRRSKRGGEKSLLTNTESPSRAKKKRSSRKKVKKSKKQPWNWSWDIDLEKRSDFHHFHPRKREKNKKFYPQHTHIERTSDCENISARRRVYSSKKKFFPVEEDYEKLKIKQKHSFICFLLLFFRLRLCAACTLIAEQKLWGKIEKG